MKEIPLTQGKVALVDDEDYEWLSQWKWSVHNSHGHLYAARGNYANRKQSIIKMHRLILELGKENKVWVDHRNRNGLDNRRENLRIASPKLNARNATIRKDNASGFRGVCWYAKLNKWVVQLFINKRVVHCGYYSNKIDAAIAYDKAALKYRGEEAELNFPEKKGEYDVRENIRGETGAYYRTHRGKRVMANLLAIQNGGRCIRDIPSAERGIQPL